MAEIWLTTWYVWNPMNNGIHYQPQLVNAGFQPSTVSLPDFGTTFEENDFPVFSFLDSGGLEKSQGNKSKNIQNSQDMYKITPLEANSEFTPENWWLEDESFLLGFGLFSGAILFFWGVHCTPIETNYSNTLYMEMMNRK